MKKTTGGATTVYIFSGSKVIAEYPNGGAPTAPTREYIYAGSQLVASLTSSGTPTYAHPDQLSARVFTDSTGTKIGERGHLPFGEVRYDTLAADKWKFTSYERDSESGLDYALFRFDSTRLGRFQTPDPLAGWVDDPQSLNRYAYTRNDPVNSVDPLGLFCIGIHWFRLTCITDHAGTRCELEYLGFDPWFCFGGSATAELIDPKASKPNDQQRQQHCAEELAKLLIEKYVLPKLSGQIGVGNLQVTLNPNSNKIILNTITFSGSVNFSQVPHRSGDRIGLELHPNTGAFDPALNVSTLGRPGSEAGDVDPHNPDRDAVSAVGHLGDIFKEHTGGKLEAPCDLLAKEQGKKQ